MSIQNIVTSYSKYMFFFTFLNSSIFFYSLMMENEVEIKREPQDFLERREVKEEPASFKYYKIEKKEVLTADYKIEKKEELTADYKIEKKEELTADYKIEKKEEIKVDGGETPVSEMSDHR